jgi:RNA exonuclease 1
VAKKYRSLYEKSKTWSSKQGAFKKTVNTSELDKIPRISLLLNASQMLREDYPIPFDESKTHGFADFVYTKEHYEPVSNQSPLYSMDCEMVYNESGDMEIVWLAIVNENLECVYEAFVKPQKKIINYLTQYVLKLINAGLLKKEIVLIIVFLFY